MPHGHSRSTGSSAGAGRSASNNINSGGVLSRVLGSLRRHSHTSDAALKDKQEDTNWANTYQITHRPDRPRHDKREGLKNRNSAYVLGQLHRIWRHNQKMMEAKRRERESRERAVTAGFAKSTERGHKIREDAYDVQRDDRGGSNADHAHPMTSLQTDQAPNFSRKGNSSRLPRSDWRVASEASYQQRSRYHVAACQVDKHVTYPPSSPSIMTIEVGLELDSAEMEAAGSGGLNISSGVDTGNAKSAPELQLLPSTTYTPPPFKPPPQPISAAMSLPQKGSVRKRRSLPRSTPQRTPLAAKIQASSARSKALRESMELCIDTDRDTTPGLMRNSSLSSEQASPLTPTKVLREDIRNINPFNCDNDSTPAKLPVCPMPLCGNDLITSIDRSQNLCWTCRTDHQPRDSIFITDVLNAFPGPHSPLGAQFSTRPPLIPEDESISPKTKGYNSQALGRLNGDRERGRGEFKLQAAPRSRHDVQQQPRGGRSERANSNGNGNNHSGFRLIPTARTATPMPSPPTPPPPRPREVSGPLLEPKTFCPAPASAPASTTTTTRHHHKQQQQQNQIGTHHRKQSDPRTLACLEGKSTSGTASKSSAPRRDHEELYREIDSIIDCYLKLSEAPDPVNKRRKAEVVASYFEEVPEEVNMYKKSFI